jgi:hypothetical protein
LQAGAALIIDVRARVLELGFILSEHGEHHLVGLGKFAQVQRRLAAFFDHELLRKLGQAGLVSFQFAVVVRIFPLGTDRCIDAETVIAGWILSSTGLTPPEVFVRI